MDWAEVKNAVDRVTAHSEGRYTYEHDIRGWLPVVMEGGKIKAPPTLVTDMQLLANAYWQSTPARRGLEGSSQRIGSSHSEEEGEIVEYPSELLNLTHCVEYSPNCHKKFMLRLVGRGQGALDKKFKSETKGHSRVRQHDSRSV